MVVQDFQDAAMDLTWKTALLVIGKRYGLVDETGRPVSRWAANRLRKAKRSFDVARREHLAGEKLRKLFEGLTAAEIRDYFCGKVIVLKR